MLHKAKNIFDKLFSEGIASPFIWQNAAPDTSYYEVQFVCKKCKCTSLHTLRVDVQNGEHFITKHTATLFYKLHNL